MAGLSYAEIVIFLVGFLFAVRYLSGKPRRGGSRHLVWLIVPLTCLIVLGGTVFQALVTFAPPQYERTSQEIAFRQERMDKVLRELTAPESEALNVPDWLKNCKTSNEQILLTSDQFSSRQEAEDQLLPFAAVLLQKAFHQHHPWEGNWNVPLAQIRERVVLQQFVDRRPKTIGKFSGDMYRLHMLINVSPSISETFTEGWKAQIVQRRLVIFGVLIGWLAVMFLLGTYYFRQGTHPENYLGWIANLSMSLVTVGVTAAGIWLLSNGIRY